MASLIGLKVSGHPGANHGLVLEQVQVWAGCKRSLRSDQVRKRISCPLGVSTR